MSSPEAQDAEPRHRLSALANAMRMFRRASFGSDSNKEPTDEGADSNEREVSPPPLQPVQLQGYSDTTKRRVLDDPGLCEEIRGLLPMRLQLNESWTLVYSLEQHGASLHTLYDNCVPARNKRPGFVLAVRDHNGYVFGAYANEYFHPVEGKRFYGNGESFLWKTSTLSDGGRRFQAFPYTGLNDFVIYCTSTFLSLGGGDGHYGLWLDDGLFNGVSSKSLTFGNEPLSGSGTKFKIVSLEVWRVG